MQRDVLLGIFEGIWCTGCILNSISICLRDGEIDSYSAHVVRWNGRSKSQSPKPDERFESMLEIRGLRPRGIGGDLSPDINFLEIVIVESIFTHEPKLIPLIINYRYRLNQDLAKPNNFLHLLTSSPAIAFLPSRVLCTASRFS